MDQTLPDLVRDYELETHILSKNRVRHVLDDPEAPPLSPRRPQTWKTVRQIGSGGFGQVYLQTCVKGFPIHAERAVKEIPIWENGAQIDRRYVRELETIIKFSHDKYSKYFVKTLGWYRADASICIAMHYFPKGDLQTYIVEHRPLEEVECQQITNQIMRGLQAMHSEGFAHRDVKPQNVLIQECPNSCTTQGDSWWVKLADFGISKRLTALNAASTLVAGTRDFMAPELKGYNKDDSINYEATDMWASGVTIFFISTKEQPFQNELSFHQYQSNPDTIFQRNVLKARGVSWDGQNFIRRLLEPNVERRLDSGTAIHHPWINSFTKQMNSNIFETVSEYSQSSRSSLDEEKVTTLQTSIPTGRQCPNAASAAWTDLTPGNGQSDWPVEGNMLGQDIQDEIQPEPLPAGEDKIRRLNTQAVDLVTAEQVRAAAHSGQIEVLKVLLDSDADFRTPDDGGRTALFAAAENGHVAAVALLAGRGANIETPDNGGRTPLLVAAREGHMEVVKGLVELGANVSTPNKNGAIPIYAAAFNGHAEVVEMLAKFGADISTPNKNGATPIFAAAQEGHAEVVVLLAEQGADIMRAKKNGATPLWVAAFRGHAEVVKILAGRGAGVATPMNDGATPFFAAAQEGHAEVVNLLAEQGADISIAKSGVAPLWIAASNGHAGVVKVLAELGANLTTALWTAASKGHAKMVKVLVELGADASTPSKNGATPVYAAAIEGHAQVVTLLAKLGADISTPANDGVTPLYAAAQEGYAEVVTLLARRGADVSTPSKYGQTPVYAAAFNGHAEVVKILAERGANVSALNKNGATPVYAAAFNGHAEVVEMLAKFGADGSTPNKNGATPVFAAAQEGHAEVVKMLLQQGADVTVRYNGLMPITVASEKGHAEVVNVLRTAKRL